MATPAVAVHTTTVASPSAGRVARLSLWVRRNPVTAFGFAIVLGLALLGLLAPLIAPYDPYALNPRLKMRGPSWSHPFGTGIFGEDIFSRVLYGARIDFGIGIGAVAVGLLVGSAIGALAGYVGGKIDELTMRIMDVVAAFPGFILALGIAGALGPSIPNLIVAIAVVNVPVYARLTRARFLVIRNTQYAMAARGVGASSWRILSWHLLPNSIAPIFVQSTLQFGWAILDAAGLSFIGLGVHLPTPEWGVMIGLGVPRIITGQWWISFFPGLAIAITVMGFNLIGDGLQDLLDPTRR
ncbi:MAG: peptide/nickel transport system permease protein [Thermomicrobiales bacterium]|nr:peptide/nickel transport system permease protein [Thermomicrobiales bacterium]